MNKLLFLPVWILSLISSTAGAQQKDKGDAAFYTASQQWFNAWKLLSKEVFHLDSTYPVDFLFFDKDFVYSTSAVSVVKGKAVAGPALMGSAYQWRKAAHNGTLTLPDSSQVPIGLMSFAAKNTLQQAKPFFVMPLPSFWKSAGVESKELGDDNLYTGVFLHEFSHSQQMQNFGMELDALEKAFDFTGDFNDNIVQDLFKGDSSYLGYYSSEVDLFYNAVKETDYLKRQQATENSLAEMRKRHARFFKDKPGSLPSIDEFFLTMEGMGQYTMYAWLTHPKGAGLPKEQVITGVRRGKNQWSQDEGFALFLILEQKSPAAKWAPAMFGNKTISVIDLLEKR
ncbi:MAG: hypothetical protein EOO13_16180 [Chitinophagaceae bacterium]|nr:MAG: hypothetical protein EOO13_16180 [Chitinophagaceae bacterium]